MVGTKLWDKTIAASDDAKVKNNGPHNEYFLPIMDPPIWI
jgi:hypothetical protein